MPIPSWPPSLPALRGLAQSAGSDELHPEPQVSQFDDGPARRRRRSLIVQTPLKMQLRLSVAEFVAFKAFHLNDLNAGAKSFTAPVLLPDTTIGTRTCTIDGKVSWSSLNRFKYLVGFTLLVRDW